MLDSDNIPPFESYFWLRAPAGKIAPKTNRKTGGLASVFNGCETINNDLSRLMRVVDDIFPKPHLTIFEQPRSQNEAGKFRFQPLNDVEMVIEIIEAIQDIASGYMPLSYGGEGLEILVKTNKVHMALNFNSGARESFFEFYDDLMDDLSDLRMHDFYKETRIPRLILSKGYIATTKMNPQRIRAAAKSFSVKNDDFITKPIELDHMILGQGLYDTHGNRLASRDISTIYFDGRPFEWHCDDPFNMCLNRELIMQHRGQAQADARQHPSPVS